MKDNNVSVRDYTSLNGVEGPILLTPEIMEQAIVDNFEKGKITEELFLGGMNVLEKGKRGQIGEIREWSGKKYQKTATGWTPVKEGGFGDKDRKKVDSAASAEQTLRARRVMDSDESTPEQKAKAKEFLDNKKAEHDKSKKGGEKREGTTDDRFKDSSLEDVLKSARTGVNTPENHQAVQELLKRASEKSGKKVTSEPEAISLLTGQGGDKEENIKKNEELNKKDLEKEKKESGHKEGSSVKLKSDVNMASLSDFQNGPLKVVSSETINMASGPYTEYTVKNSEGKTAKINGKFLED